jgi:hypothetical protein
MDCVPRQDFPGTDWPLFLPVVGPFIALGTSKDRPAYALALLGAGQVVGVGLFASGLAIRTPYRKGSDLMVLPSLDPRTPGVRVSSTF